MKRSDYKDIISVIKTHPWDFDSCLCVLKRKFPQISDETLRSILGQQHKERVKATIYYQVRLSDDYGMPSSFYTFNLTWFFQYFRNIKEAKFTTSSKIGAQIRNPRASTM